MSESMHSVLEAEHQEAMATIFWKYLLATVSVVCATVVCVALVEPQWTSVLRWGAVISETARGVAVGGVTLLVLLLWVLLVEMRGVKDRVRTTVELRRRFWAVLVIVIFCGGLIQLEPELLLIDRTVVKLYEVQRCASEGGESR